MKSLVQTLDKASSETLRNHRKSRYLVLLEPIVRDELLSQPALPALFLFESVSKLARLYQDFSLEKTLESKIKPIMK